jgi:cbb3-type cytochrome oxidase subunit 3
MLRDIFQSVNGFEYFGIISTLIFVAFFILVVVNAYTIGKKDVEKFSRIPLDDSTTDSDKV